MSEQSKGVIEHGKAVMNYPGAKARLAPWIIEHLPEHNTFVNVVQDKLGEIDDEHLEKAGVEVSA